MPESTASTMKSQSPIRPFLSYSATLCGLRGDTLDLPGQCILDCSGSGRADEAVAHWAPLIDRPATLTPDRLRTILREVGAWSEEDGELADDSTNWTRAVWMAACNMAEDEDPDACVVLPLTGEQEEDLREAAWAETGRDAVAAHLMNVATDCTDLDAWPDLKTSRERVLALLESDPAHLDRAADYLQPFLDQPEVDGVSVEWDEDSAGPDSEWVAVTRAIRAADSALWDADVARDVGKLCDYLGVTGMAKRKAVELRLCRVPLIRALV